MRKPWGFTAAFALTLVLTATAQAAGPPKVQSFWVWDLTVMPPGFRQPTFTEAAVADLSRDRLHVMVEDGLGAHEPGSVAVQKLVSAFTRDIDLERPIFGDQPTPPSADRDIYLLVAAIPPYENHGHKYGFDGFFNVYDQITEAAAASEGQHSNERNIIYVNALQDVAGEYMLGVVSHELNHLLTHARYDGATNPLAPWLNEMLGEAAMQLAGYYTDAHHVDAYRAATEQPLAVMQYGISYGGLSLFAEYLMRAGRSELLGALAPAHGDGFARVASVYGRSWNELFEGYARWLFETTSAFPGAAVAARAPTDKMRVAPTGVLYLDRLDRDPAALRITATPAGCTASLNVVKTATVHRANAEAHAVWIESTPPCAVARGGEHFDAFTVERRVLQ